MFHEKFGLMQLSTFATLSEENSKLKRIVADKAMLQDPLSKSSEAWPQAGACRQGTY